MFDKILSELRKTNIKKVNGQSIKLAETNDGEFHLYCGWNYPDETCDYVWEVGEKLGVEIEPMADAAGYKIKRSAYL